MSTNDGGDPLGDAGETLTEHGDTSQYDLKVPPAKKYKTPRKPPNHQKTPREPILPEKRTPSTIHGTSYNLPKDRSSSFPTSRPSNTKPRLDGNFKKTNNNDDPKVKQEWKWEGATMNKDRVNERAKVLRITKQEAYPTKENYNYYMNKVPQDRFNRMFTMNGQYLLKRQSTNAADEFPTGDDIEKCTDMREFVRYILQRPKKYCPRYAMDTKLRFGSTSCTCLIRMLLELEYILKLCDDFSRVCDKNCDCEWVKEQRHGDTGAMVFGCLDQKKQEAIEDEHRCVSKEDIPDYLIRALAPLAKVVFLVRNQQELGWKTEKLLQELPYLCMVNCHPGNTNSVFIQIPFHWGVGHMPVTCWSVCPNALVELSGYGWLPDDRTYPNGFRLARSILTIPSLGNTKNKHKLTILNTYRAKYGWLYMGVEERKEYFSNGTPEAKRHVLHQAHIHLCMKMVQRAQSIFLIIVFLTSKLEMFSDQTPPFLLVKEAFLQVYGNSLSLGDELMKIIYNRVIDLLPHKQESKWPFLIADHRKQWGWVQDREVHFPRVAANHALYDLDQGFQHKRVVKKDKEKKRGSSRKRRDGGTITQPGKTHERQVKDWKMERRTFYHAAQKKLRPDPECQDSINALRQQLTNANVHTRVYPKPSNVDGNKASASWQKLIGDIEPTRLVDTTRHLIFASREKPSFCISDAEAESLRVKCVPVPGENGAGLRFVVHSADTVVDKNPISDEDQTLLHESFKKTYGSTAKEMVSHGLVRSGGNDNVLCTPDTMELSGLLELLVPHDRANQLGGVLSDWLMGMAPRVTGTAVQNITIVGKMCCVTTDTSKKERECRKTELVLSQLQDRRGFMVCLPVDKVVGALIRLWVSDKVIASDNENDTDEGNFILVSPGSALLYSPETLISEGVNHTFRNMPYLKLFVEINKSEDSPAIQLGGYQTYYSGNNTFLHSTMTENEIAEWDSQIERVSKKVSSTTLVARNGKCPSVVPIGRVYDSATVGKQIGQQTLPTEYPHYKEDLWLRTQLGPKLWYGCFEYEDYYEARQGAKGNKNLDTRPYKNIHEDPDYEKYVKKMPNNARSEKMCMIPSNFSHTMWWDQETDSDNEDD